MSLQLRANHARGLACLLTLTLLVVFFASSRRSPFDASARTRRLSSSLPKAAFSEASEPEHVDAHAEDAFDVKDHDGTPSSFREHPESKSHLPQCGVRGRGAFHSSAGDVTAQIVNGQDSKRCEWNWQVSLRRKHLDDSYHFCGGSLISNKWVMTAAHCVADDTDPCSASSMEIVLGDYNKDANEEKSGVEVRLGAKRIVKDPGYYTASAGHDFALIELSAEVHLNDCIGTVCLPSAEDLIPANTTCHVTGWGTLSSGGSLPSLLQEASVTTYSNEQCNTSYGGGITSDMMCAQGASDKGLTDTCQGDSGGPLVCEAQDGRYFLQGVTSWGRGCAQADYPGVYARVTSAIEWIHQVMASEDASASIEFDGEMWAVTSGSCMMDEDACITSPGYPSEYSNDEGCTISVNASAAVPIDVWHFDTEYGYDKLFVDCQEYSGTIGPDGVLPSSSIVWKPDSSVVAPGWKICPSNATTVDTS